MEKQIEVTLMVFLLLMTTVAVKKGARQSTIMSTCYIKGCHLWRCNLFNYKASQLCVCVYI